MKMELTVSSKTLAIRTQTPGNYPKRKKLHLEHGESLKTRTNILLENIDHCQKEGGILLMLMCHTYYFHTLTTNCGVVTHL